jgi:hypothetical protein
MLEMAGYTPLFNSIVTSSVWNEDSETRIVWITLLALADANGKVEGSVSGLAPVARVSLAICKKALNRLKQPDPYSRTKEYEGRRIEDIDGGWQVLNYIKFREKAKMRTAEYYKNYRKRKAILKEKGIIQTETNTDTETGRSCATLQPVAQRLQIPPSISDVSLYLADYCKEKNLPPLDPQDFIDFYEGKGWIVGKVKMKDWQAAARRAARNWERKAESRDQRFDRLLKEKT